MASPPFTPYQRRLFAFLSVATFFEGYDFVALTQILPNLRADLGIGEAGAGVMVAVINVGTVLAYVLVRGADRWGRRRVLTVTIAGYTVCTFLTGLAPNAMVFAIAQLFARVFLVAEWAVSMIYAAEEFPAARRGTVIGVINAFSSLGAIMCAGVVPLLLNTPWGWRTVYLLGIVPLALVAIARRSLRETARFEARVSSHRAGDWTNRVFHIFRTPYRRRMLHMALIWGLMYMCFQTAITFWKEFAVAERGFSDAMVGQSVAIAALGAMPIAFAVGPLLDRLGRRPTSVLMFSMGSVGVLLCYSLHGQWPLTIALVFGIAAGSSVPAVLNAFNTELFPTELRADAFGWANNLLGRIGYLIAPILVGVLAQDVGWGGAIRITAVFPLVSLVLILALLPETRSQELETTSAV